MRHIKRYARLAGSSVHKERLTSYLLNCNISLTYVFGFLSFSLLPVCPCLARRSLSPDSGVAAILSSLTQSPGEQSTLFHVVV